MTATGSAAGSGGGTPSEARQIEHRYGIESPTRGEVRELQRLEFNAGVPRVRQWASEGMPIEAMSEPTTVERFRERKGTPVPWNVEEHNEQSVQRSTEAAADTSPAGDAGVPDTVREVINSPGRSLDASIQRAMEDRMDDALGDVRIHTGPDAAQACESIDARAFTVGNHVAFNAGEYDPSSAEGQHVLAHELAHVRQQTGGAVSMLPQDDLDLEIDPDPALEREAEETAQRVMEGGELGIQRLADTEVHVQRSSKQTGFGQDGSVSVENVEESELPGADDTGVNVAQILRSLGKTGAVTAIGGGIAKAGAVLAGVSDPAAAQALLVLSTSGTALTAGWMDLYKQIDPQVVRSVFAAADKETLLDRILERLGEDVETGNYPGDS